MHVLSSSLGTRFIVWVKRTNGDEIETNQDGISINVRANAHLKYIHKKLTEMEAIISLKDFEIWKRKFSDYLVLAGLSYAPRQTEVANFEDLCHPICMIN